MTRSASSRYWNSCDTADRSCGSQTRCTSTDLDPIEAPAEPKSVPLSDRLPAVEGRGITTTAPAEMESGVISSSVNWAGDEQI